MEKKTMGAFMAVLRKANGMTQQEVADRLNISNKTVSKWECDEGYPEITMLPAIAELYSVTVDELLRGERIFREENEQTRDAKGEKQVRYIFERVMTKFTNLSILSIALGVTALFISYFADFITPYSDKTWIVILLAILMIVASALIQIIAFNNLKPNLTAEEAPDKTVNKAKKKAMLYLCVTIILTVASIIGIITYLSNEFAPAVMLIPGLLLGLIVAFAVYRIIGKSLGIDGKNEFTAEYLSRRERHIKVTAVIVCVVCVFSAVFPFAGQLIDYWFGEGNFCFTDAVGYQYNSTDDAINDYNKLKNFFMNGDELYYIIYEEEENFFIEVCPVDIVFDATKDGLYTIVSSTSSMTAMVEDVLDGDYYTEMKFETREEFEEYKRKYVWYDDFFRINTLEKDIRFDDSTYTVFWKNRGPELYLAFDIMPVFILGASAVSLVIIGASAIIWNKKKKRMM